MLSLSALFLQVTGPSSIFFSYLSQSRGNAELGAVWRNGVGTEYIKEVTIIQETQKSFECRLLVLLGSVEGRSRFG